MRIGVIKSNFASLQIWQNCYKENVRSSPIKPIANDEFVLSRTNSISFEGYSKETLFQMVMKLRNIKNMPCAYTEVPMIPPRVYNSAFVSNTKEHSLEDFISFTMKFKKNLNKVEKDILNRIMYTPNVRKSNNLQETMIALRKDHLERLSKLQLNIFDKLINLAEDLPQKDKELVLPPIKKAVAAIKQDNLKHSFKRKKIIKRLENLLPEIQNKGLVQKIINEAYKLPSSKNNQFAFIAKYSKGDRSSKEIEQRIISSSIATFDHLWAKDLGGENTPENAVIVSSISNCKKTNKEFLIWFNNNPQKVQKSTQKQVNFLINRSNKGYLKNMAWYIITLKNSFYTASKGQINLDISRLKMDDKNLKIVKQILNEYPEIFGFKKEQAAELINKPTQLLNV